MTLQNANHIAIRVVNTTQCHMTHQLVWYAHFNFIIDIANIVPYSHLTSKEFFMVHISWKLIS